MKLELYEGCCSESIYINDRDFKYVDLKELNSILKGKINIKGLSKDSIYTKLYKLIGEKGEIINSSVCQTCFDSNYLYELKI